MKINKIAPLLTVTVLVIATLACNLGAGKAPANETPAQEDTSSSGTTATEAPAVGNDGSSGACDNPLLPIKAGASWTYKITGPVPDTFTRAILAVNADGFTDKDSFGSGVTRESQWKCENGNLIALNPDNGTSSSINAEGVSLDFQTVELTGVTLPAVMNPGDSWSQFISLAGTETINDQVIPATNQTTTSCTAVGVESVTVEAGTFDAMRFDCQTVINILITMNGSDIPATLNLNSSNWHAENIGLIKTVSTGDAYDSTVELISYSIP